MELIEIDGSECGAGEMDTQNSKAVIHYDCMNETQILRISRHTEMEDRQASVSRISG